MGRAKVFCPVAHQSFISLIWGENRREINSCRLAVYPSPSSVLDLLVFSFWLIFMSIFFFSFFFFFFFSFCFALTYSLIFFFFLFLLFCTFFFWVLADVNFFGHDFLF